MGTQRNADMQSVRPSSAGAPPAAATADADAESGDELGGADATVERERELRALKVMFKRGLISKEIFERRAEEIRQSGT